MFKNPELMMVEKYSLGEMGLGVKERLLLRVMFTV